MIVLITGQRADSVIYIDDSNHAYVAEKRRNAMYYLRCKKTRCPGRSVIEVVDEDLLNADIVNTKPHDHPPQPNIIESAGSVRRRLAEPGFEDELIREVRNRPTIWDRKSKHHKNRTLIDQEWDQIAAAIGCPRETCKAKWMNMRDVFIKEFKSDRSKGANFDQLMFLIDTVASKTSVKEETSDDDDDDRQNDPLAETPTHSVDVSESPRAQSPEIEDRTWLSSTVLPRNDVTSTESNCAEPPRKRRRTTNASQPHTTSSRYAEEEAVEPESEDEDILFLRSLAPYLKHLPPVRKLRLRGKIENLIADEIGRK